MITLSTTLLSPMLHQDVILSADLSGLEYSEVRTEIKAFFDAITRSRSVINEMEEEHQKFIKEVYSPKINEEGAV